MLLGIRSQIERYSPALLSIWLVASVPVMAQQNFLWRATIAPEQINVYVSASTRDGVSGTLKHGDVVNVVLEVNVMGDSWCRVASPNQSNPLGYVLCLNLQKGGAAQYAQSESAPPVRSQSTPGQRAAEKVTDTTATNSTILTNKDILDMSKMGFSSEILVAKITSTPCNFDTSPSQLQQLKSSGLSDAVILAMVQAPIGQTRPAVSGPSATDNNKARAPASISDGKTRVLVTDSQSWETRGGGSAGGNKNGWGASSWIAGGARPQTAEIIKTLNQRCPEITVTNNLGKADFVLTLDHEGGKGLLAHRNKIAIFNKEGDDIFSNSTRELGNAIKDACQAMLGAKK